MRRCEACPAYPATMLVDFGDGQRPFAVCLPCARIVDGNVRVTIKALPREVDA